MKVACICATLCVTSVLSFTHSDPRVKVKSVVAYTSYNRAELECLSTCPQRDHHYYVWYKNGEKLAEEKSNSYTDDLKPADVVSCAVVGYEHFPSPPVL